jgi:hypothetical protein
MKTDRYKKVFAFCIFIGIAVGCGDKDKDKDTPNDSNGTETSKSGSNISITGSLSLDTNVSNAVAISVAGGALDATAPILAVSSEISATGSLAIEINSIALTRFGVACDDSPKDEKHSYQLNDCNNIHLNSNQANETMLMLIDETQEDPLDRIVGFVGMGGGGDSLIRLPIASLNSEESELDLGELKMDAAGDYSDSSNLASNSSKFSLSENILNETAKVDSVARHVKNIYANRNDQGIYYSAQPFYIIDGDATDALAQFSDVTAMSPSSPDSGGFGIYFRSNDSKVELSKICAASSDANHVRIDIIPPADVKDGENSSTVYSTSNPMSNQDVTGLSQSSNGQNCQGGTFFASGDGSFNVGAGGFGSKMPDGKWVVNVDQQKVATFDLASAKPFDSQGKSTIYMPSVKISSGSDQKITTIEVKWFVYSRESSTYVELENLEGFNLNTKNLSIEISDYTAPSGQAESVMIQDNEIVNDNIVKFSMSDIESVTGGTPWNNGFLKPGTTDPNEATAESVSINYELSGISFRFDFRTSN